VANPEFNKLPGGKKYGVLAGFRYSRITPGKDPETGSCAED